MNSPAKNVSGFDRPVIAQRHEYSQQVAQGVGGGGAPRNEFGGLQIEHDKISLRAHLEPPDAVLELEAARGAERCKIKRPQRRKVLALQPRHLTRLIEGAKHAEAAAAAHIGGGREAHPGGVGGSDVEQPAAKV